ncbi:hypothetical protein DYH09_00940 [bacterium CPR1]|nr:hypothetical protein [bacterium CPR1]
MIDPVQRRAITRLVRSNVEPESQAAIKKAARQSSGQDLVEFSLSLLEAIPPSPVSHVEGGAAGLAVLEYLARQSQAPAAIQAAAEAAPKTMFPTSRRALATIALESAAAASPSAFARMGIEMMKACRPYPFDGATAGTTVLEALSRMPLDETTRSYLCESRLQLDSLKDHEERAEQALKVLAQVVTLSEHAQEVSSLARSSQGGSIQETPSAVRVGGVLVPRRRLLS